MKRLGDILVESGFLNANELAEVLSVQKETGKRLGEVIVESGLMSEFDILRAVSSQYNYPIIDLSGIDVDPKATALLTQKFCEDNVVFPIGFDGDNLVVAIDDPMNITIEDELQFQTGYQISRCEEKGNPWAFGNITRRLFTCPITGQKIKQGGKNQYAQ